MSKEGTKRRKRNSEFLNNLDFSTGGLEAFLGA
jgi:hypothetical protein